MMFNIEDIIVDKSTGERFCIMASPINCKSYYGKEPYYVLANHAGEVRVISKLELFSGSFHNESNPDTRINRKQIKDLQNARSVNNRRFRDIKEA